ncbi:alpha/beta fold hydrolase [Citreimonas salinaria]|uniref:Pimeloyl-ACP methyl ester carboxylesterase n=1 Tax=Citreimonas salinaria TaxID=321339 RepID=A0A1H3IIQ1_9RHOB|nr:alpha/beta hydrolase [Citreimonas salinaria]SDY26958.1 Pimeloyl-ACP methyl ester carboxylesterase [Citreimonas salinaria]
MNTWTLVAAVLLLALAGCGVIVERSADRAVARAEERWPPVGQFTQVDDSRVHYVQRGTGPDVVLIHGAGGNLRDMTFSLVPRLVERGFRVTAFDRPGLGYTDRIDESYAGAMNTRAESPQQQAALLAQAARQIGVEDPVVVGHSFGGSVAMAWALDHDAAAVVSLAGAIMPWPGDIATSYKLLGSRLGGATLAPLAAALIDPMQTADRVEPIFAPNPMPEGYLAHIGPGLSLRPGQLRANARQVQALKGHLRDMSPRYAGLSLPVELVHGAEDDTVGLDIHSVAAAEILPDANLTVLEGVGHMPHHAREGAVVEAIVRAAERAGLR